MDMGTTKVPIKLHIHTVQDQTRDLAIKSDALPTELSVLPTTKVPINLHIHSLISALVVHYLDCMSLVVKKTVFGGFPTRSDTNRAVQSQKMARGLKFRIKKVEGLYYLCR